MTSKKRIEIKNDLTAKLKKELKDRIVSVYIDGGNLYHGAFELNMPLNFEQMFNWFDDNCSLIAMNYYSAYNPESPRQVEFLQELREIGYNVKTKEIKTFSNKETKGNMDIELAVDAILDRDYFETLVLISGDSDFQPVLEELIKRNKKIIVFGLGGYTSYDLHQQAHSYFFMDRISKVWKKTTSSLKRNTSKKKTINASSNNSTSMTIRAKDNNQKKKITSNVLKKLKAEIATDIKIFS